VKNSLYNILEKNSNIASAALQITQERNKINWFGKGIT
jgi:serine/threonine protein kinase